MFVGGYGCATANADHRSLGRRDSYGIFVIQKMRTVTLSDVKQSFRPGERERQISRICMYVCIYIYIYIYIVVCLESNCINIRVGYK